MPAAQHIGCVRTASTSKSAPYMARRRIKVKDFRIFSRMACGNITRNIVRKQQQWLLLCILSHITIASKAVQNIAMHIVTATYHTKKCAYFLIPYRDNEYTGGHLWKSICRCPSCCNITACPHQHCRKKQFLYWQRMWQTKLDFHAVADSAGVSIGDRMTTLLNLKIQEFWGVPLCC